MRLLDLFCGAGGAAMGYHRAGFDEIVGVDIAPQKNYPFTFVQADAMTYPLDGFDAIHASPPCQAWSGMQRANVMRKGHPELVDATRERLMAAGAPWVIENVPGAPLRMPFILCGLTFNLRVLRHRLFESSQWILVPPHRTHAKQAKVRGKSTPEHLAGLRHIGFTTGSSMIAFRDAMGVDWMTPGEARQAIPPAYTEFIGRSLIETLKVAL